IGMSVTFIGLIILVGLVYLNKFIADSVTNMRKGKKKATENAIEKPAPVKAASKSTAANTGDESVIAAITAAISVVMEGKPFKVTSVKRASAQSNTNAWDMVAIQEQNNNL
ncbi:MAG: OadG family protein, partial [Clostridia bacterium]|nr:OadG family protein [Clostridia bacterium]